MAHLSLTNISNKALVYLKVDQMSLNPFTVTDEHFHHLEKDAMHYWRNYSEQNTAISLFWSEHFLIVCKGRLIAWSLNLLTKYAPIDSVNVMTLEASTHINVQCHDITFFLTINVWLWNIKQCYNSGECAVFVNVIICATW